MIFDVTSRKYNTSPQKELNGRTVPYARGKVLGGSSSISELLHCVFSRTLIRYIILDYSLYNTGSEDDWNRYARIAGDERWSWDSIQPILCRIQSYREPADGSDVVSSPTSGENQY
jgi:choline dehydrogenase-like flavoprotein